MKFLIKSLIFRKKLQKLKNNIENICIYYEKYFTMFINVNIYRNIKSLGGYKMKKLLIVFSLVLFFVGCTSIGTNGARLGGEIGFGSSTLCAKFQLGETLKGKGKTFFILGYRIPSSSTYAIPEINNYVMPSYLNFSDYIAFADAIKESKAESFVPIQIKRNVHLLPPLFGTVDSEVKVKEIYMIPTE